MHVINLLLAFTIPYFSLFQRIAPEGLVPIYFDSKEAAFMGCEFYSLTAYWLGFLRSKVDNGKWSDPQYFMLAGVILFFIFASKFILLLSDVWFCALSGFGLGWLSVSYGQSFSKYSIILIALFSAIVILFACFILIGMGWFDFTPVDYYFYKDYLPEYFKLWFSMLKNLFWDAIQFLKDYYQEHYSNANGQ
jgi:hypothetical protein